MKIQKSTIEQNPPLGSTLGLHIYIGTVVGEGTEKDRTCVGAAHGPGRGPGQCL